MMLKQVISYVFRKKGGTISISEFVFALSLDLKWFSPDQAESVLKTAEKEGLVQIVGDMVEPLLDPNSVEIPIDFKPDQSIFAEKTTETIFDQVIDRLQSSGAMGRSEIVRTIHEKQNDLGIVETDATALLVARMHGIDVTDLIDEAYDRLI
ncbi:MAG: DUF2240 family protein [Candidatus Methanogasteraceae archaeon]|uniref:DUF2240 family protein n=1 Tax=Candidatus Methanogaster sp. ANME-2c ERB4 TaxID=2759911 RepID=A0A7G9YKW1_9EURY|nr:hypothetical protein HKDIPMJM_00003 [Methanosarcinales archaeon ANME-2c ERB4]QNO48645.1 hypothetical protein LENKHJGJ_00016 [Methanosarcinales archaeon ANME-2c ERB4]QNO50139.1 hypothetical protein MOOMDFED_00007 [Methanosarcinales archaeon ANME-2c ERB4]QNO50255.1 hypothetical protein KDJOFGEH_00007 [Methanosarcinales archaeon ANME-2c ERB4]